jgi:pimeloyl-ACP methyl ester carboxylesterase
MLRGACVIEESKLVVNGDAIAVWDRPGAALPIVMIHGNSCSKDCFRPLFDAEALAEHRLIAFDLPGCGASSDARDPDETYTLPGLGRLIVAVIRELEIERYVLLGWSLGGHLAIQMLLNGGAPDGIVLTGTPPCGPDPAELAATFLPVPGSEMMSMAAPPPETREAFLKIVYAPSAPSAEARDAVERSDGRLRSRLFAHFLSTPDLEPQRTTIARWLRPFALIQGRDEPFFDPAKVDALQWGKLWRGGTQWIDGAGHAPFISHTDAYARLVKAFADDLTS